MTNTIMERAKEIVWLKALKLASGKFCCCFTPWRRRWAAVGGALGCIAGWGWQRAIA